MNPGKCVFPDFMKELYKTLDADKIDMSMALPSRFFLLASSSLRKAVRNAR